MTGQLGQFCIYINGQCQERVCPCIAKIDAQKQASEGTMLFNSTEKSEKMERTQGLVMYMAFIQSGIYQLMRQT